MYKTLVNHRLKLPTSTRWSPPPSHHREDQQVNFGQVERTDARAFDIAWLGVGMGEKGEVWGMKIAFTF